MALSHEMLATESGGEAVTEPIRKTTFTRAAGAVLVAAVLGAAVLAAGGYASGRHVGISAGSNDLKDFTDLELRYVSDECDAAVDLMEKKANAAGRKNMQSGHDIECASGRRRAADQKACKFTVATDNRRRRGDFKSTHLSWCLPADACQSGKIRAEVQGKMARGNTLSFFQCGDEEPWYNENGANGEPDCDGYCKKKWSSSYHAVSAELAGTSPYCGGSAKSCRKVQEEKFGVTGEGYGMTAGADSTTTYAESDRVVFGKTNGCWSKEKCCWSGKKACCCILHNIKQGHRLLLSNSSHSL